MALNLGIAGRSLSTSKDILKKTYTYFCFMLSRYFCPKGTVGQYIYVGKFNEKNNNFLHISHVSAYRYESGYLNIF